MNQLSLSELWVAIPGYEGRYEVSSHGRLRTVARMVVAGFASKQVHQKLLYQHTTVRSATPYRQVTLWIGCKSKSFRVHTLVLLAFTGPRPDGFQCRHLDGDSLNNAISNLVWGTCSENIADRSRHGRHTVHGEHNPHSKLNQRQVVEIREAAGPNTLIAAAYGVTDATVSQIKLGKTWRHLPCN